MPKKKILEDGGSTAGEGFASEMLNGAAPTSTETIPTLKHAPAAMGDRQVREIARPAARTQDSLQGVTQRLGATLWEYDRQFDWATDVYGRHYIFTRWYFQKNVIINVYSNDTPSARLAEEKKRACVDAENERRIAAGKRPIGYMAIVRGAFVPDECFEAVLRGETLEFIARAPEGVLTI